MDMLKETVAASTLVQRWQALALGALWCGFVIYAVLLSPPDNAADTLEMIRQLSTGQWATLNPVVVVLFNLMGLWPLIYASLALSDGREQTVPAWPFVVGAFGLGVFALLPYLALRKSTFDLPHRSAESVLLRVVNHRLFGAGVVVATLLLLAYGFAQGQWGASWQTFLHQFSTSRFIHVMSLDFCMLTLLTPRLLWDDMARRGVASSWRLLSLVPLLGPALYLALRPAGADNQ
ncbi:MAG: DUF2834 domain-containing protein [Cyanobacteria bacterium P01_D01_bin.2]